MMMSRHRRADKRRIIPIAITFAVFFALVYVYLWLWIDPRLIYHAQCPIFLVGPAFARSFLGHPGGLIEYACAFLSQSYAYPSLGALVITLTMAAICLASKSFFAKLGNVSAPVLCLIPAVPLVMLHGDYDYPLTSSLGLLIVLLFVNIYIRLFPASPARRAVAFLLLSAGLYHVTAGPCLLFMGLCGLFECLIRANPRLGIGYLLFAAVAPALAAVYVFDIGLPDAYAHLLPFYPAANLSMTSLVLYGLFPLATILIPLRQSESGETPPVADSDAPSTVNDASKPNGTGRFAWVSHLIALLVVTAAAAFFASDRDARTLLRIDYCARNKLWPEVLREARHLPAERYRVTTHWDVNRALFHTGRLADEMFAYPQRPALKPDHASSLICGHNTAATDELSLETKVILGEIYLELGRVGEAEFRTNEGLAWFGDRPAIVTRLFLIHLIKRESEPAKTFLSALGRHLLFRDLARHYRQRLEEDPFLDEDETVEHIRSIMMIERHLEASAVETMLQQLLDRNNRNRAAFEYLMGHYLLTLQVEEITREIGRLDDFDYTGIPRHYEEALLLHEQRGRDHAIALPGRTISSATRERFDQFMATYQRVKNNRQAAIETLVADYGDSYLFYYTFGFSGGHQASNETSSGNGARP